MSIVEDEFDQAFQYLVKLKANNTKNLRKAAEFCLVCRRSWSKSHGSKGAAHVKADLAYATRHGDIELENHRGEAFQAREKSKLCSQTGQQASLVRGE